jgi:hypothetical protein
MKNIYKISALCLLIILSVGKINFSQQKLAQTGMKFLLVSPDARASALGDAVTALEGDVSSLFFNPAGLARQTAFSDVSLGQVKWIADINYYYGAASFAPYDGNYGVLGLSMVYVDYGDFLETIRASNDAGYIDMGIYNPKAYYFGVTYSKALNDKFSIGGNLKYAVQDLDASITAVNVSTGSYTKKEYKPNVLVFDFGMLYHTGFQSLSFGAVVRNFSKEMKLEGEGFQLPLIFKVGVAYNAADLFDIDKNEHSIQLTVEAVHPRDFAEQINAGVEYKFMNLLALRAGWSAPNDEHNFTAGVGFQKSIDDFNLGIDYAYVPWTTFSNVHKFSLHFGF